MQEQQSISKSKDGIAANSITSSVAKKDLRKKFWYWSIFIIIAALAVTVILVKIINQEDFDAGDLIGKKPIISDTLPEGYEFQIVPEGKLPAGFPAELVLAEDYKIIRGEDTIDGLGASQKKADLAVSQPAAEIFSTYQAQMPELGWKNIVNADQDAKVLGYKKAGQQFFVTVIAKTATTSQVGLTLVTPK